MAGRVGRNVGSRCRDHITLVVRPIEVYSHASPGLELRVDCAGNVVLSFIVAMTTCALVQIHKLCQTQPQREKRSKFDINFAHRLHISGMEEGFVRRERPGTHTINLPKRENVLYSRNNSIFVNFVTPMRTCTVLDLVLRLCS